MTLKRIIRERWLTPEEAERDRLVREQVAKDLPELIARHHELMDRMSKIEEDVEESMEDDG